MQVSLPESVYRYCTDRRIRSAVDLLLSAKSPKLPDGLAWSELPDFYRACLAAQQTRVEWALALEESWRAVFEEAFRGWASSSIETQAALSDICLDIGSLWTGREFYRDFQLRTLVAQSLVQIDPDRGIRISVALWIDDVEKPLPLRAGLLVEDGWLCSAWLPFGQTAAIDLTGLQRDAAEMVAIVRQFGAAP